MHHCPSDLSRASVHDASGRGGSFVAPDHEYPSHLELKLTATDSGGLEASSVRAPLPADGRPDLRDEPRRPAALAATRRAAALRSRAPSSSDRGTPSPLPRPGARGNSYEFVVLVRRRRRAATTSRRSAVRRRRTRRPSSCSRRPSSLSANPSSVVGGSASTGTVVLSGPAPRLGRGRGADELQRARRRRALERHRLPPAPPRPPSPSRPRRSRPTRSVTLTAFYGGGSAATAWP